MESKFDARVRMVYYAQRILSLPVDGALFLEFVPGSHQWLLTLLSAWWSFGQLVASLVAWGFISRYSCTTDTTQPCPSSENQGWRYTLCVSFVLFGGRKMAESLFKLYVGRYDVLDVPRSLRRFQPAGIPKILDRERPGPRSHRCRSS